MEQEHRSRLEALSTPWCQASFVVELLGMDLTDDRRLTGSFRSWSGPRGHTGLRNRGAGPEVHRHALETYLQQNGLVSWKWAAVFLGMPVDRMKEVVERLEGDGWVNDLKSPISDQVVRQREAARLHRAFPSLRNRVFGSHSADCRALHDAIRDQLNMEVDPVLCVTSVILDPDQPDVAAAFDAITLEPVGLRYQVWLETRKPLNLAPDVCSLKFYAHNDAELSPHVMRGNEPEVIDPRLRAA